ncbi:MAG: PASTA domain-containing protein [Abditibacteriota bacterium]|nr:PASTA domain-containing protein [Abditibacteriota bacterium]
MAENTLFKNRFEIIEKQTETMVFNVFLARDNIGERQVSLYIMKPFFAADPAFVEGYRKGAEECGSLDHPSTLRLLETDSDDTDAYFVYEPVKGKSLAELLAGEKELAPVKASEIMVNVLNTLDSAHTAGLCHGDLTDDDIIITEDRMVKVRGFGRRDGLAMSPKAREELDKYTIYFQSPEVVQNELPEELSDIYSAGAVYYRILTGHVPFSGSTAVEVASRILENRPPDLRDYNHRIPENIASLVLKALSKAPADRIETASIFAQKISSCIKNGTPSVGFQETKPNIEVEHPREPAPPSQGMLKSFGLILLVLFLSAAATFFVASYGKVVVPDVVGMSESEAVARLEEAGFLVERNDPTYSEEYKEGLIIFQTPGGGRKLKKGDRVTIQASLGNEFVVMPDVVGKHKGFAVEAIVGAGLKVGSVRGEYSDDVPEDYVVSTNPEAGLSVAKDTPVDILISNGERPAAEFDRELPDAGEAGESAPRRPSPGEETDDEEEYSRPSEEDTDFDVIVE